MTEGLFLLTAVFVAYVIYVIANEKKAEGGAKKASPATQTTQQALVAEKPKAAAVVKAKPAVAKTVTAKLAAVKKAAPVPVVAKAVEEVLAVVKGSGLKDPKTGEVATTYTNYRFTKRWIKEALVAEKLVDKIYKNDELNADVEAKIKTGLAKLEGMKKYKP